MTALSVFLVHVNRTRRIFGDPPLLLNHARDRRTIAEMIEFQTDPVNMPRHAGAPLESISRRREHLSAVARDLETLDPAIRVHIPQWA